MGWKLKQTKQCAKCPWKVSTNPPDIPGGYDLQKHKDLIRTISPPNQSADDIVTAVQGGCLRVMACHEHHDHHCVGWLANQMGCGNNIPLRMMMLSCDNVFDLELDGDQHETFEDTLP